ncbi:MAG: CAP domain-containing protein [Coriobacteriia bacterium]|nr:CAP domain-containing protein [Coriobacteriia bacterium]
MLGATQPAWADDDSSEETYNVSVTGTYRQSEAYSMLAMINEFRTAKVDESDPATPWVWGGSDGTEKVHYNNLGKLKWSTKLEKIAMQRAAECALRGDHRRPNGKYWATVDEDLGLDWGIGRSENLSGHLGGLDWGNGTADDAFVGLREDDNEYGYQGHRLNMLGNWASVGIACFEVAGDRYWVQAFGNDDVSATFPLADGTKTVQVEMSPRYVAEFSLTSPFVLSLSMGSNCTSALPVSVKEEFDSTGVEFTVPLSAEGWTVESGSDVVKLEDGSITALKSGKAVISNTVLGSKTNWTVSVTDRETPTVTNFPNSKTTSLSSKTLALSPECNSTGTRSFKSSDESVATVSSAGVVTLKKAGTTKITVSYAGTDVYEPASASCSLTVTNSNVNTDSWTKDPDKENTWTTPDGNQVIVTPGTSTVTKVSAPAKTSISKLAKAKKAFTVKWKKKSGVAGYQVRYSLKSSMKGSKTVTVKSAKATSKKVSKLKKKKRYYVQVRTYKMVSGKTYWSGWSAKKSVKTK